MGTDRKYLLGEKAFTSTELSALVLQNLREEVESALGEKVSEAVVTVPAYFGELQRRATRDACELAGLRVERIINEPTAAALAYGLHARDRELRAMVLDLGGGTFDVTVLEILEGVIEIQSTAGDTRPGGEDFVDAIVAHVRPQLEQATGLRLGDDPVLKAMLREASERAKHTLSSTLTADISLPTLPKRSRVSNWSQSLSRAEATRLWRPLLEKMQAPILRALRDAHVRAEQIDQVLLVGGATRMPCVSELAEEILRHPTSRHLPPDEAVALGAAVQAAIKDGQEDVRDVVVTDVAPFSLGIAISSSDGVVRVDDLFAPILDRGTVLPASRVRTFSTVSDNQRHLEIAVYQGEHALCSENVQIGSFTVYGIPPAPAGRQPVEVRFSYDLNGVLEVDATVTATGQQKSIVIEQSQGRLTQEEIEASRERLKRLKFHPREALPNVTALARAEALFLELVGNEREALARQISNFRVALESQDSQGIQRARDQLIQVTTSLQYVTLNRDS